MTWHNIHILVTGAGGFIGSHLVECLLGEGARVRAFVRYNGRGDVDHLTREPCLEIVAGDLRDSHAVSEAVRPVAQGAKPPLQQPASATIKEGGIE